MHPFDESDVQGLLRNADVAMYLAKELGSNFYQFDAAQMVAEGVGSAELNFLRSRAASSPGRMPAADFECWMRTYGGSVRTAAQID